MKSTLASSTVAALALTVALQGKGYGAGPAQRVVIDKTAQELRAYEHGMLVFSSNVSTGKPGKETPSGRFHAGDKSLIHYSTLYENAPMPYSVQVGGNYFIHGFSEVPSWPASHGCIRLPIDSAREFYHWVHPGARVDIVGHWAGVIPRPAPVAARSKRPSFFARLFGARPVQSIRRAEPTSGEIAARRARSEPDSWPGLSRNE